MLSHMCMECPIHIWANICIWGRIVLHTLCNFKVLPGKLNSIHENLLLKKLTSYAAYIANSRYLNYQCCVTKELDC